MTWGAYKFASRIEQIERSRNMDSTCTEHVTSVNCEDGKRENAY